MQPLWPIDSLDLVRYVIFDYVWFMWLYVPKCGYICLYFGVCGYMSLNVVTFAYILVYKRLYLPIIMWLYLPIIMWLYFPICGYICYVPSIFGYICFLVIFFL